MIVDQITKHYAEDIVRNEGILFGLSFSNSNAIMIGASISAAIILFIITFFSKARGKFFYSLILGGVIGNLIDRITLGYVVDFIKWGSWPVFNIADACISSSVVFLLIINLIGDSSFDERDFFKKFKH